MRNPKRSIIFLSLLAAGLTYPLNSSSQQIDDPIDSIRAPFSSEVTYTASVQLESISPTTGNAVLTGTATKIAFDFINDSVLLIDLVGKKTTDTTVSGVRVTFTVFPKAASGWEQVSPWGLRKVFTNPLTLPVGKSLGCRYDMPAQKFTIASVAATSFSMLKDAIKVVFGVPVSGATITWITVRGNIKCAVGVKAADILPPVVVIPPPTPVPDPIPISTPIPTPPILVNSFIDSTELKPGDTSIVFSGNHIWVATAQKTPVRMEFFIDGVLRTTELNSPYQFNGDPAGRLDTTTLTNGIHILKVVATFPDATQSTTETTITVRNP